MQKLNGKNPGSRAKLATGQRIFVGVSGGVDSSVALALLKNEGHDVRGVFLKVWSPDFLPCTWRDERRSAMRVCATLGVPFLTLDCEKEYKELVVDYMLSEYKAGRTPNPDVFCNKYVKFGIFLTKAMEAGADYIATGHYASISSQTHQSTNNTNAANELEPEPISGISEISRLVRPQTFELVESLDVEKDQSYFLHQLNQEQLSRALFPIGHLQKSEVRELAKKFDLPTAEKKDSQGLCFIGKVDMKEFLAHYIKSEPGNVLNESGEIIGRHDGAVFYTIGERHGWTRTTIADSTRTNADPGSRTSQVAEQSSLRDKKFTTGQALRLFVLAKDISKNTITVGPSHESRITNQATPNLPHTSYLVSRDSMNWISGEPDLSQKYDVRFRYRQEKQKCQIKLSGDNLPAQAGYEIIPENPQLVASGQSAVIYDNEICLGGGVIN